MALWPLRCLRKTLVSRISVHAEEMTVNQIDIRPSTQWTMPRNHFNDSTPTGDSHEQVESRRAIQNNIMPQFWESTGVSASPLLCWNNTSSALFFRGTLAKIPEEDLRRRTGKSCGHEDFLPGGVYLALSFVQDAPTFSLIRLAAGLTCVHDLGWSCCQPARAIHWKDGNCANQKRQPLTRYLLGFLQGAEHLEKCPSRLLAVRDISKREGGREGPVLSPKN